MYNVITNTSMYEHDCIYIYIYIYLVGGDLLEIDVSGVVQCEASVAVVHRAECAPGPRVRRERRRVLLVSLAMHFTLI